MSIAQAALQLVAFEQRLRTGGTEQPVCRAQRIKRGEMAVTGDELTFTVLRKDPLDRGLTGTGAGKVTAAATEGTMRLSRSDAHVIREARFSLARVAP